MIVPPKRVQKIEDLKNVYYVYGDEEFLVKESLARLKAVFSGGADTDFNLHVVNAVADGADHVIESADTVPLFAPRRLVIARDADKLNKKEQEKLIGYLEAPNPATTLVLVAEIPPGSDTRSIKKVESSALFKKVAEAGGEHVKLSFSGRGKQRKLAERVTEEFARRGKKVQPQARDKLIELVGSDLRDLSDAVERISLYVPGKGTITHEDVVAVVVPAAEQGVFELVDAVADRRRDVSLYLLNRLVGQGESPQRILGLLLRQFRLISRCKSIGRTHEYGEIARSLGIPPFLVGKCLKQATRFSSDRLRRSFGDFAAAQVEMHSNRYLPDREYQAAILEMLIVKLTG